MKRARALLTDRRGRIVLTFADQAVSSVSNFVTGVVIARLSGAAEFGDYALALTVWLIVVGLHRALVTEPVIVTSRELDHTPAVVARGVSAEVLLGAAVSAVVAVAGGIALVAGLRIGALLLALSPWFPALLVQDYWRAMAFRERRPGRALVNDLVFAGVQFACIALFVQLGWRSAPFIITAWGIGATAGAAVGLRWFPGVGPLREGWALLRDLWGMSRWLLADFVSGFTSDQAYIAFAALLLSRTDYGGVRAAISLMGPAYVITLACGNLGLPAASHLAGPDDRAALRHFTRRLSLGTTACIGLYGAVVIVAGRQILSAVYGSEFARFAPVAFLGAIAYVLFGLIFGPIVALKAAGRMRRLWRVRAGVAVGSLASMVLLVRWLGAAGAGWTGLATTVYFAVAVLSIYRRELGSRPVPLGEAV